MSEKTRKPATFKLDDENVIVVNADEPGRAAPAAAARRSAPAAAKGRLPA